MNRFFLYGFTAALLGSSSGCGDSAAPTTPLTTSFDLLNEQGQVTTVFAQGQNIIFRFQFTNPTDDYITLRNPPFDVSDFLEVTRLTAGEGARKMGKPYTNIFCTYQNGVKVSPHPAAVHSMGRRPLFSHDHLFLWSRSYLVSACRSLPHFV